MVETSERDESMFRAILATVLTEPAQLQLDIIDVEFRLLRPSLVISGLTGGQEA